LEQAKLQVTKHQWWWFAFAAALPGRQPASTRAQLPTGLEGIRLEACNKLAQVVSWALESWGRLEVTRQPSTLT
jgi:hypothetical protein